MYTYCMNQPWLTTIDWPVSALSEGGEEQRRLGDVLDGGELAVDGLLQHDVLDHVLLGDAERLAPARGSACRPAACARSRGRSHWRERRARAPSLATTLARPIRPCLAVT